MKVWILSVGEKGGKDNNVVAVYADKDLAIRAVKKLHYTAPGGWESINNSETFYQNGDRVAFIKPFDVNGLKHLYLLTGEMALE